MTLVIASSELALTAFILLQNVSQFEWITPELVPELFGVAVVHAAVAVGALIWWRGLYRRRSVDIRHARAALLLGLLSALYTVDRFFGILAPPPSAAVALLQPHSTRGWSLKPSMIGTEAGAVTRTNHLGLRGPEISETKPPNETRILFVGDSVTFGYALSEELSIVAQFQTLMNRGRSDRPLICINAGICGYQTWQERDLLENEGFRLKPDAVILGFSLQNDVADAALFQPGDLNNRNMKFEFSNSSHWSGIVRAITSARARREWSSKLALLAPRRQDPERDGRGSLTAFNVIFKEPAPPEIEMGWSRALAEMTKIADACRDRGIPFAVMIFTSAFQANPEFKGLYPQDRILAWGAAHKAPVFDAWAALNAQAALEGKAVSSYFIDDGHPNATGSRIIAEHFARFFVASRLLEK